MVAKNEIIDVIMFQTKNNISALRKTLRKYGISDRNLSVGELTDEAVCVFRRNNHWEVFIYEKGIPEDCCEFKNINDACRYVISCFAESEEDQKELFDIYKEYLSKTDTCSEKSAVDLWKKIKSSAAMFL